jgi:ParB family chromosome partitioning protein
LLRLLDLPDEALDLLERGVLSAGHGRAILTAPDHGARRRLAREAAVHGWSVRETEAAARRSDAGEIRARRLARPHPDQVAAAERLGEAFGRALGADVRVTPAADGYRVSLAFSSLDEALEAASRLGAGATS